MASKDFPKMAHDIVARLGGTDNLSQLNHCATRLRVTVKDSSRVDTDGLKKVSGVLGVELAGDNCQVIVGQIIEDLFLAVEKEAGEVSGGDEAITENKGKRSVGELFKDFLLLIAGILSPCIPALIVAGFLSTLLTIMTLCFGIDASNPTYSILYNFSQSAFYFLPVFVAYTSAKKFGTEPVLAMLLACGLLYPGWTEMVAAGSDTGFVSYFGLPVYLTKYNGAVVQIILSVWIMSKLDGWLKRAIPEVVRHFLKPFVLLLIMSVITLTVTGPLGGLITNYVVMASNWINDVAPWLTVAALVTFALTVGLAAPGFHLALVAVATTNIATIGYDNLINIYFFSCTITSGFLALAVFFKTRNGTLRQIAFPAALSALFGGVSEPGKYGILFKMPRTYYAYMIVSISTALIAGILKLKCFAFGGYSITNILLYLGTGLDYANFRNALILVAYMAVASFVCIWALGFDDSVYGEDDDAEPVAAPAEQLPERVDVLFQMPAEGSYVAQADLPDNTFAQGVLGPCFGVKPSSGDIVSPIAGTVFAVAGSKHAITLTTPEGAEVLVHIGVDSVKLDGKGLEVFVEKGQRIEAGQRIATFDADVFAGAGIDDTIICTLMNGSEYSSVVFDQNGSPMLAIA